MNQRGLKAVSLVLAAAITCASVLSGCAKSNGTQSTAASPASSEAAQTDQQVVSGPFTGPDAAGVKKSETVFINLDPTGKPYETTVTDWIHSDTPDAVLNDLSDLTGIENIKGLQQPRQEGDRLTWKMEGSDLYYTGKTDKEPPVDVEITYTLDGKSIEPQELPGKSGQLSMTVRFRNTQKQRVTIAGKDTDMYTPMLVAAGMSLPDDTFQNVEVSEGSVISDGSNQIVAFACVPGLNDSLALGTYRIQEINDLDFPEEFTVKADVQNFEMGPVMVAVTPELPDLDELTKSDEFDDMRQDLTDLQDMQDDLNTIDPDRDIRSLLTDPNRTEAARVITNDVFDFYDLNKDLLDILPKYVTDENIRLYDRIRHDIKDGAFDSLLDDDELADLIDLVDDLSPNRLQELADDYAELQKNDKLRAALKQLMGAANPDTEKLLDLLMQVYGAINSDTAVKEAGLTALNGLIQRPELLTASAQAALRQGVRDALMKCINVQEQTAAGMLQMVLAQSKLNSRLQAELVAASYAGLIVDPSRTRAIRHADDVADASSILDEDVSSAPDEDASSTPDEDAPSTPDEDAPSTPDEDAPSTPDEDAPSTPDEDAPSTPDEDAPSTPDEDAPSTPDEDAPSTPDEDAPSTPDEDASSTPDEDASSAPDEKAPTVFESITENTVVNRTRTLAAFTNNADGDTSSAPNDGTSSVPNGDTSSAPDGDTSSAPDGDTSSAPDGDTSSAPDDDTSSAPDDNTSSAPDDDTSSAPNDDTSSAPFVPSEPIKPLASDRADLYKEITTDTNAGYYLIEGAIDAYVNNADPAELLTLAKQFDPQAASQVESMQAIQALLGQIGPDRLTSLLSQAQTCEKYLSDLLTAVQQPELKEYLEKLMRDLQDNEENLHTLILLLRQLDDMNLLDEVENIDDLREDLSDLRPIVQSLRRDLDRAEMNKSLHASPETVDTLLRMKDDLEEHRDIMETMRNMLQEEKVTLSRSMIATLDRLEAKDAAGSAVEKLDDLDELLERKDRYTELSDAYRIFTAAPDSMDTDVKFVMKTDEIKLPDDDEPVQTPVQEQEGFVAWFKGLFQS
ncbi:hypothetical protein [Anaerotruncus colihominis]|uniref:Uncharacterized protein n=1 Tax=Anaerotruncus colihominis DSM 17241 TaxID=445972 RepID=B0P9M4_9FIRM|nr:hypothetical protein [Anaerotruncus colihominis]EDS11801.1 hypothetical protein ANACOL_01692 [Anaerotruncus colihominis DSM 17241]UOX64864.1 hypothetical protein K5I23_12825 [Anaerotruncus colihominis]UWN73840.1 hypothetical protein NQ528_11505 [Anaerotruncus colihominis]